MDISHRITEGAVGIVGRVDHGHRRAFLDDCCTGVGVGLVGEGQWRGITDHHDRRTANVGDGRVSAKRVTSRDIGRALVCRGAVGEGDGATRRRVIQVEARRVGRKRPRAGAEAGTAEGKVVERAADGGRAHNLEVVAGVVLASIKGVPVDRRAVDREQPAAADGQRPQAIGRPRGVHRDQVPPDPGSVRRRVGDFPEVAAATVEG